VKNNVARENSLVSEKKEGNPNFSKEEKGRIDSRGPRRSGSFIKGEGWHPRQYLVPQEKKGKPRPSTGYSKRKKGGGKKEKRVEITRTETKEKEKGKRYRFFHGKRQSFLTRTGRDGLPFLRREERKTLERRKMKEKEAGGTVTNTTTEKRPKPTLHHLDGTKANTGGPALHADL